MRDESIGWCIEEFMGYCQSKDLRMRTLDSYEQSLRLFERWLMESENITEVGLITEGVIRKYILSLQERGKYSFYVNDKQKKTNYPERRRDFRKKVSPTTINNYMRNIKVFINWLDANYCFKRNPVKNVKAIKNVRKAKDFISDDEFEKLIGMLDKSYFSEHRDYTMINLMIDSGMRLGECSTLLVDDIDLARRKILLRAEETKGGKDRAVFFSEKTEKILRRWIQYKDRYVETSYLFPVKKSAAHVEVSSFETNFKGYLRRAGLKQTISPHCLRNNFAKRCLMNGMDIYTLSRILGHSSIEVTEQAYLDLTEEDLGKRFEKYSPLATMR